MDDFGMLARDFGFRPQGKSAPMKSDGIRPPSSSPSPPVAAEDNHVFSDVFGGPPKFTNSNSKSTSAMSDLDYDSIFKNAASTNNHEATMSMNLPVYDKPVYDDDIFDGLPGLKSKSMSSSASPRYEDNVFASMTKSPPKRSQQSDHFDDLLGNIGRKEKVVEPPKHNRSKSPRGFDDLLPGFGSGSPASSNRSGSQPTPKSTVNTKETSNAIDDPFVVLESTSTTVSSSQGFSTDPLEETVNVCKSRRTKTGGSSLNGAVFDDINPLNGFGKSSPAFPSETKHTRKDQSPSKESTNKSSFRYFESQSHVDNFQESHQTVFDLPEGSRNDHRSFDQTTSPASYTEKSSLADDIWLTVSEIPLFTQPTRAPPPSRPPPLIPRHISKPERGSLGSNNRKAGNGSFSPNFAKFPQIPRPNNSDGNGNAQSGEELNSNLAAAAMKEAMDRAEAKFKHAKEVREREHAKSFRNREKNEQDTEEELRRDSLEREKEEEEREQRRLEREKARQVVERATREARERAAIEARERASVEARLKTERAAVQRAQAEARERAAVGAKERAERAAAEARERAEEDARHRAERAAVERVAAEARKRAAAEARERAAASRINQQKNDNDLESFFGTGSRPSSAPRPRTTSSDSRGPEGAQRTSTSGVSSNMRKASSTTNIVDDLSSIFGASPTVEKFQEVEGETKERRRARMERQQRTQERAAKALAEKNQRDLQSQREQEERHRIGGTLDVEIKRWAAGKEGNLRALLSTLQYVLWPECGWQPVSLTDLITGANVKKAYRKATLCIHPDKVQQKGANLQQKYVAEKVFDILKEAWNKFNSEELF